MATKVLKRKELSFINRTYLPAVFLGLWITSRHFFKNLAILLLHSVGLMKNVRAGSVRPAKKLDVSNRTQIPIVNFCQPLSALDPTIEMPKLKTISPRWTRMASGIPIKTKIKLPNEKAIR